MEPRCKIRKLTNRKAPQITKVENQNLRSIPMASPTESH